MEETGKVYGDEMGRGAEQGKIDAEKFGNLLAALRREHEMTQRQLAEKLYVSNKAVSKWERGLSLPDIALLEPLADTFGITVTELLHGERQEGSEVVGEELTQEVNKKLVQRLEASVEENSQLLKQKRKKRLLYYLTGAALAGIETALLYLQGFRAGITAEEISRDVLIVVGLPLIFGIWFFFLIREKLPAYYDTEKIYFYADGFFRMNVPGVYFNNTNWPRILKAGRGYCLLTPVLYPVLYFILRLLIPSEIWLWLGIFVQLTVVLGGLFVPIIVAARYEKKA
ncbi:MAG: helix-turn-helix domain-containing protein [bacterium]|nr:helix-turn-helix domain-containing protein [bacterium]